VFSYTNHTLMPEALETWPVALMQRVLPRHLEIIFRINHDFLLRRPAHRPGDHGLPAPPVADRRSGERRVRMAHLSIVGSHKVNGVSALHSDLLVETIFADFASLWPDRFTNMTNGVTPRRWLAQANPGLAALLDRTLGAAGARPGPAARPARHRCRRPGLSWRLPRRQARQQGSAWRSTSRKHHRHRGRTRPACSTCRSSASTNTSASCSTCCTWSRATRPSWPARRRLGAAHGDLRRQGRRQLPHGQAIIRLIHDVGR
jgi:glucan phosphorylase